ncbi:MAG: hypothetical protein LBV51_00920 [Acholeplasmatales bacterium]|jgi:uncharacterized FAD-dependent dehydrogenase|nr:hypothetical protein [Acholeplasmatales bacterium]
MKYLINNVKVPLGQNNNFSKRIRILTNFIFDEKDIQINRKALDMREHERCNVYSLIVSSDKPIIHKLLLEYKEESITFLKKKEEEILVVGTGPAGLFFSLVMLYRGVKVTLIERGKKVEERDIDCNKLLENGIFDPESNFLYGEGGAGTFSDGKIGTGVRNGYIKFVLKELFKFGASEDILYDNKPHLGTDYLKKIVKNIRNYLLENGVNILFETKLIDFDVLENNKISVLLANKDNKHSKVFDKLILGTGTSDVKNYSLLKNKGIEMEPKAFSLGFRIEHLRKDIDNVQYKGYEEKFELRASDYQLAYHGNDRSAYTFCMCPGGFVIPTMNEEKTVVVNGMSNKDRNNVNSNSALLVNINVSDYYKNDVLDGFYYRKQFESASYSEKYPYCVPVQRLGDFIDNKVSSSLGNIKPSVKRYYFKNLNEIYPSFIRNTMLKALDDFEIKIKGFKNPDSILSGVETRSSAPVTVIRKEGLCTSIKNIYCIGDGSGYSGGIMSAITDAIKVAVIIE